MSGIPSSFDWRPWVAAVATGLTLGAGILGALGCLLGAALRWAGVL